MRLPHACLSALLALALGCGASSSPPGRDAPGSSDPTTKSEHEPQQRSLGLEVGVEANYLFTARFEEQAPEGVRRQHWTCAFTDRVLRARDFDALGALRTIIEVRRTVDLDACDAPQEDWQLTPRPGRIFYIIGGTELTHEVADYSRTREGLALYRQDHSLDLGSLDAAELVYVLPLRPGVLWHNDAEARRDARAGARVTTLSRRTDAVDGEVVTPAGSFNHCAVIITWAAASANDTTWVCDGQGAVRRTVEKIAGNLRFNTDTVLTRITHP